MFISLFSEMRLNDLAAHLRPHTAKTTRVEMAPWAKAYTVDMKDIYTELTLDKIEINQLGQKIKSLRIIKNCSKQRERDHQKSIKRSLQRKSS